ncbi:hypothetical protein HK096_002097, partial [Nowakowskiella sp. JEL0078]
MSGNSASPCQTPMDFSGLLNIPDHSRDYSIYVDSMTPVMSPIKVVKPLGSNKRTPENNHPLFEYRFGDALGLEEIIREGFGWGVNRFECESDGLIDFTGVVPVSRIKECEYID